MNLEAEETKKKGNECMKEDKFFEAVLHYTKAIKLEPSNPSFYSNRSLAFLKIQQYHYALEDAKTTIKLMPKWTKGYFRKGEVEFATEHYAEAIESYKSALEIEPGDGTLQNALNKATIAYKAQRKSDSRIPWYGVAFGLGLGIFIVLADQVLTDKPVMQNEILQTLLVLAVVGLGYGGALAYKYLVISQRTGLLDPPLDIFPGDSQTPGVPGSGVPTSSKGFRTRSGQGSGPGSRTQPSSRQRRKQKP